MSVGSARRDLYNAALRLASLRDEESLSILETAAEHFAYARKHARARREKWKERRMIRVGDGIHTCRIEGCTRKPTMRPVLEWPAADGGKDPIRVETALLDVCWEHSRTVGPEAFLDNPDIRRTIAKVWTDNGLPSPDPRLASVTYTSIRLPIEIVDD